MAARDEIRPTPQQQKDRTLRIKAETLTCRHFTGIHRTVCRVGVNYRELVGGPELGWATRIPCIVTNLSTADTVVSCSQRDCWSADEALARVLASDQAIEQHLIAYRKVHSDAKAKGYRKKHGGMSECICPICKGVLRYSVASYNGHIHAKCETAGCITFME